MKKGIHPTTHTNAKVTDLSTGKSFNLASTKEEITVEVTSTSHPFYTGKHRIVDTENLVKKFEKKRKSASGTKRVSKREKAKKRRNKGKVKKVDGSKNLTLRDMLKQLQ
ncbi:MAG: 50S ribosomal protein L31 [Candidatus Dojkabacteria bacterium]